MVMSFWFMIITSKTRWSYVKSVNTVIFFYVLEVFLFRLEFKKFAYRGHTNSKLIVVIQTKDIQKAYRGHTFAYRGHTNIYYYHKRKLDFIIYLLKLLLPALLQIFTIQCGVHSIKPQLSTTPPLTPVSRGTLKADTDTHHTTSHAGISWDTESRHRRADDTESRKQSISVTENPDVIQQNGYDF